MSETVHYKGKLTPTNKTIKEYIGDVDMPSYYEDVEEYFSDNYYKSAEVIEGKVYEVGYEEVDPDYGIFNSKKLDSGVIEFEVRYYNGGCSFTEAIEEALTKGDKT